MATAVLRRHLQEGREEGEREGRDRGRGEGKRRGGGRRGSHRLGMAGMAGPSAQRLGRLPRHHAISSVVHWESGTM